MRRLVCSIYFGDSAVNLARFFDDLLVFSRRYFVALLKRRGVFAVRELSGLLCDLGDAQLLQVRRQQFVIPRRDDKVGRKKIVRSSAPQLPKPTEDKSTMPFR